MQAETAIKVTKDELEYNRQQLEVQQQSLGTGTAAYTQDKAELEKLGKEIKNLNVRRYLQMKNLELNMC